MVVCFDWATTSSLDKGVFVFLSSFYSFSLLLPAMHLVIFSDFDGTISVQDTGVVLIDHCIGRDRRIHLDEEIFKGSKSFREAVQEMWDGVNVTWPQALEMLQSVPLDDHFNPFCQFCHQMGFPIYVLSG